MDFVDAGERIAYVIVAAGWSNVFNFTVPTTAVTGSVNMRVRISYSVDGAIIPCDQSTFGEVEDYKVNIVASSGLEENLLDQVTLYPNPTQDNITLNFGAASSTIQRMELTSITGQVLKRFEVKNNNSQVIEMGEFAAGIYQVVIYSPSGIITKRIIKN